MPITIFFSRKGFTHQSHDDCFTRKKIVQEGGEVTKSTKEANLVITGKLSVKDEGEKLFGLTKSFLKKYPNQTIACRVLPAFAKVCKWLKINKLSLNTVKTEFMLIGTSQRLNQLDQNPESTPYAIVIDQKEVRRVKCVKYLGMIVDDKLTWSQHVDYISSKITRNIGILKRIRHFIPKESLLLLYHTLIEPYFKYCSIVWGQCSETLKGKLQTLQNKAARALAKVRYDEANHSKLLTDFSWLSVKNLIKLDMGIFAYKELNNLHPEQDIHPFQETRRATYLQYKICHQ